MLKLPIGAPRGCAVGLRGGGRLLATAWDRDNEFGEFADF